MGNDDALRKAAIGEHTETALPGAEIVVARRAMLARATPDPRVDDIALPGRNALRIRAGADNPPRDLVTDRARQRDAAILQLHHLAAAHVVGALPEMQIRMANAAVRNLDNDFGSSRHRLVDFRASERSPVLDNDPGAHHIELQE